MLKIGYVPEHFSSPLLQLAASEWGKENIKLVSQPSGTGQMLTSFQPEQEGGRKIDVAVALTEALITGIAKGRKDYTLVGSYVRSSLNWAVITGTDSKADKYKTISDLRGSPIGISRIGSGSQIMASVMAMQQGWIDAQGRPEHIEFKVNDTFANLRDGVNQKTPEQASGAFMWEWFTTWPFVKTGEVRFIGAVPTPWPSWTIAASTDVASSPELKTFLAKLQEYMTAFATPERVANGSAAAYIQDHFSYDKEDVETWLDSVRWAGDTRPNHSGERSQAAGSKAGDWVAPAAPTVGQDTSSSTLSKDTLRLVLDMLEKAGVLTAPSDGWNPASFVSAESVLVK
ncbi:unnamed protein product [Tilletia controversa]|nr:unnamed protein product [Tilletia caries]CAD6898331.1 unnamed protein product [Tilletia laevis]CAD6929424.1 unnamed protein product [Tilletia controversa]CAD6918063.1 unnamed protein product [Tilletia laevis]CAD6935401.1 unnamed protein product [Tilletia caries]